MASQAHEKPCHFFTRSGCLLGNTCPFPHVGESGAEPSSSAPAPNKPLAYSQTVCTYFASSGSCKFGKHCRLLHSDAPSRPGAVSGERVKMCHFMLNFGKCRLGDECGFSHLCTSFSRTSTCQYGDSCRFQHSSD
ncbi:MAG: hypothetical protein Q8P67_27420 [archaeon]|nr:hypothetical protein [archaeon]